MIRAIRAICGYGKTSPVRNQAVRRRLAGEHPRQIFPTGGRQRRFFTTRVEAEGFVRALGVQIENYGRAAPILKPGQGEEALAAIRLLEKSSLE